MTLILRFAFRHVNAALGKGAVFAEDLFAWVEYSNQAVFKSKVLGALHMGRFIEYDRDSEFVTISPTGINEVETRILKQN